MLLPTYYGFIDSLGGLSCIRHERDQDRRKEKKWLFFIINSTEEGKSTASYPPCKKKKLFPHGFRQRHAMTCHELGLFT